MPASVRHAHRVPLAPVLHGCPCLARMRACSRRAKFFFFHSLFGGTDKDMCYGVDSQPGAEVAAAAGRRTAAQPVLPRKLAAQPAVHAVSPAGLLVARPAVGGDGGQARGEPWAVVARRLDAGDGGGPHACKALGDVFSSFSHFSSLFLFSLIATVACCVRFNFGRGARFCSGRGFVLVIDPV